MTDKDTDVRIGKFTIIRRLGRGGMGAVYEGYDPALDRRVAIKTLTAEVIADKDSRSRFEREAKAAAKLQHTNIVTIYELGNFGGKEKPYIVMEYLQGTDVATLIGKDGMPIAEALDITIQLCRALDFAHHNGVVHRDVKPANLRYLDDGQVKIMDFGIAHVEGGHQITKEGMMIGTVHYMAPEQIRGQPLDGRTDIFAAGCILYELLSGGRPFVGESATSILYNIVNETPAPIVKKNGDLPQEIQDVLDRAMAKRPENRFATAGEMARELEKIVTVFRKTLPRTTQALQESLDELASLSRAQNWQELVLKARALLERHPQLDEARRHLRRALRELRQNEIEQQLTAGERTRHLEEIHHEITELYGPRSSTMRGSDDETELATATPTRSSSETPPAEGKTQTSSAATGDESTAAVRALAAPIWALVIVVLLGLAGVLYWLLMREPPGPQPVAHTVEVRSQPAGAAVYLNGVVTGVVTDEDGVDVRVSGMTQESHTIEVRLAGFETASNELTLALDAPGPIEFVLTPTTRLFEVVTTPPGATVELDGKLVEGVTPMTLELSDENHEIALSLDEHNPARVELIAGRPLPTGPIALTPLGRPGTFQVQSNYPVAIFRGERELASASTSPSVVLRPGSYQLRLSAPDKFLARSVQVTIRESDVTTLATPSVGRVNVRANPGNCTVTIDGMPAGSPPFMNREVVTGAHEFVFTWPGGVTDTQNVTVEAGRPTYVIGQRP
jgi:serine/threonine protein kinase